MTAHETFTLEIYEGEDLIHATKITEIVGLKG